MEAGRILKEVAQNSGFSADLTEKIAICEMHCNDLLSALGNLKQVIVNAPLQINAFLLISQIYVDIGNLDLFHFSFVFTV